MEKKVPGMGNCTAPLFPSLLVCTGCENLQSLEYDTRQAGRKHPHSVLSEEEGVVVVEDHHNNTLLVTVTFCTSAVMLLVCVCVSGATRDGIEIHFDSYLCRYVWNGLPCL